MTLISKIRSFLGEDRGAIAIEFGLVISILIVILMGCFEASRYILLNQKLDRTSSSVADLISQAENVTTSVLSDTYAAADEQTEPFDLSGHGRVIISSIYKPDTNPATVQWQCKGAGSYTAAASTVGTKGGNATMPSTIPVDVGENIIVAEVYYDYKPFLFQGIFKPTVFRHTSFMRPRGALLTNDPGC
ncbi:MAG TPA: TadE/TadG family type IV pilus assembly protein [Candidatus Acidoferrum sp.]|nr:TadE/TadG family type IV pilus assembly protein [Candidatus Acidoferrum sp.]